MRILYLSHRVPYPPNKGEKIRAYHHIRHMARRHEVHLVSFVDQPEDEESAVALHDFCSQVVLVRLDERRALVRGATALAAGKSLSEGYLGARAMWRAVRHVVSRQSFDVAWAFSSAMAQYLPGIRAPLRIADFADVDSEKWRQFSARSRGFMRWAYRLEALRLRAFERRISGCVDRVFFVSPREAALFRTFCPPTANVQSIPIGVDTSYYAAGPRPAMDGTVELLFTGSLDYRPNVEAVLFFARRVLPLIRRDVPGARFTAVGHRPGRRLLREARKHVGALEIAGSVPDVRPYFRRAHIYVAPLHLGRGVQNKVLEAMAMRVPVVASPLAVAGIEACADTHAVVAETAEQFAASVLSLLRDPEKGQRLTDAAFQLIVERYNWADNLRMIDACLGQQGSQVMPLPAGEACTACSV